MITETFLLTSIWAMIASGLVITGFVMMHAAYAAAVGRRYADQIEQGRLVIAEAVSSGSPPSDQDMALLLGLPTDRVISMVEDLTQSLRFDGDQTIRRIARDLHIPDRAIELCGSRRWWRRLEGTRLLDLFDPASQLRPQLLQDRHPLVRAQAAEWSARDATPNELDLLVGLLGDSDGLTRHAAKDALIRIGDAAAPFVAEELERSAGLTAVPALEVAASINDSRLLPGALRLSSDDEPETRALATKLLGVIGGSEALAQLAELLQDEDARVRAMAAEGLGNLSHWPRGPELAVLLEDLSWDVRRAAGLALGSIGAPGRLLLRRARSSADPFAADMAHQVLDLFKIQERTAS